LHFFEKYFYDAQQKPGYFPNYAPKPRKQRMQKPPRCAIRGDAACHHGGGAAKAQIPAANAEAQVQPSVKGGAYKKKVPKMAQRLGRGAQKFVA
jgi:hypothetical protein